MPIEIKELHIKVHVQDDAKKTNINTSADSNVKINEIVSECVEQVLNILKEKQER